MASTSYIADVTLLRAAGSDPREILGAGRMHVEDVGISQRCRPAPAAYGRAPDLRSTGTVPRGGHGSRASLRWTQSHCSSSTKERKQDCDRPISPPRQSRISRSCAAAFGRRCLHASPRAHGKRPLRVIAGSAPHGIGVGPLAALLGVPAARAAEGQLSAAEVAGAAAAAPPASFGSPESLPQFAFVSGLLLLLFYVANWVVPSIAFRDASGGGPAARDGGDPANDALSAALERAAGRQEGSSAAGTASGAASSGRESDVRSAPGGVKSEKGRGFDRTRQ